MKVRPTGPRAKFVHPKYSKTDVVYLSDAESETDFPRRFGAYTSSFLNPKKNVDMDVDKPVRQNLKQITSLKIEKSLTQSLK